jgi:hypothetical protein
MNTNTKDFEILLNRQEILDTNRTIILGGEEKILGFSYQHAPSFVKILDVEYYQTPITIILPEHQKYEYKSCGVYAPITYRKLRD